MIRNAEDLTVLKAEIAAYSKQAPVLYLIAIANAITIAFSHYAIAPVFLTIVMPAVIVAICGHRTVYWLVNQGRPLTDRQAESISIRTTVVGGVVGVMFLIWLTALWMYGTPETRGHINLVIGVTGVAAVVGMEHMRQAAILMGSALTLPFAAFLLTQGQISSLVAINLIFILGGVFYVLTAASTNFKRMVLAQIETKRLGDENLRSANCDNLTELPNRRRFFSELQDKLDRPAMSHPRFAVGVLDLDGFKPVNDLNGHVVGDEVLKEVGRRLLAVAGNAVFVARLGGDEFGFIMHDAADDTQILAFGECVRGALEVPIEVSNLVIRISGSAGFAVFPDAGSTAVDLYERADYALYHIKKNGRGRTTIFTRSQETQVRNASRFEQALHQADLDAELFLHYQPVMDAGADRTIALEALARWHNPVLGNVSPSVFIPIAERSELISTITHTLLKKALAAARHWPEDVHVSFNLSMRDLMSPPSIMTIVSIVRDSCVAPRRIAFEVTETALMGDFDQVEQSIRILKLLGVEIALDDFGTGYSSLSQVHRFSFDKIKIDRSFVMHIETDNVSRTIVRSIVDLCRSLNIGCIAEGMETEGQARILTALGCNEMQGYLFSRPLAEQDVLAFLTAHGKGLDQPLPLTA